MRVPVVHQILDHYRPAWGLSIRNWQFSESDPPGPIYVAEYAVDTIEGISHAYATVGVSRHPMPGGDQPSRIELFTYASEAVPEIAEALAGLGHYPFQHNTKLGWGHRVPGTAGIVSGSPLTDVIFLPPLFELREFATLHLDGTYHVNILWVLPIYPSERQYASKEGWRALVKLFQEVRVRVTDFGREPVV